MFLLKELKIIALLLLPGALTGNIEFLELRNKVLAEIALLETITYYPDADYKENNHVSKA